MPLSIGCKLVSMKLFKQNERAAGSEGDGGPSQGGQPSGSAQKASTQRGNVVSIFGRGKDRRTKHELEFLPAAIEIVETPPSPIGRAIGLVLIVVFCVALLWAWLGTVDIVAVAHGKIVPSGRTKVIQPFETGVVRSIYVHDGQSGAGRRCSGRARSDHYAGRCGTPKGRSSGGRAGCCKAACCRSRDTSTLRAISSRQKGRRRRWSRAIGTCC